MKEKTLIAVAGKDLAPLRVAVCVDKGVYAILR